MPSVKTKVALLNQTYRTAGGLEDALLTGGTTAFQPTSATLTALSTFNTVGLVTQITTGPTFAGRTLAVGSTRLTVAAGNGSTGNPTFDVASFPSTFLSDTATLLRNSTAGTTFSGPVSVTDAAYSSTGWDGSLEVPTKNAVRDKFETLASGGTLISEQVSNGTESAITFSSIPGTYKELRLECFGRTDEAVTISELIITCNNDSSAIYDVQRIITNNATATAGQALSQTGWINTGQFVGSSGAANHANTFILELTNYADTVFYKEMIFSSRVLNSTTTGTAYICNGCGDYRSTSAISRIDITIVTALKKYITGSTFRLYGLS
jgi:hypothetical protein